MGDILPEKWSPLRTIAVVCTKLEKGASEEEMMEYLDLEDDVFSSYVEFALENKWIIKQEDGKYTITNYGKEFISELRSSG